MTNTWYDQEEDVLNIQLSKKPYWKSIELDSVIIDISNDGTIIAVEIINASKTFAGEAQKVIQAVAQ